jgi:hypothetical protein
MLLNHSHHVLTHYNLSYTRPLRVCALPLPQPLSYSSLKPHRIFANSFAPLGIWQVTHLPPQHLRGRRQSPDAGRRHGSRAARPGRDRMAQERRTGAVIDLKAYEAVVDATHRYKGIFCANESSGEREDKYGGAGDDSPGTVH